MDQLASIKTVRRRPRRLSREDPQGIFAGLPVRQGGKYSFDVVKLVVGHVVCSSGPAQLTHLS